MRKILNVTNYGFSTISQLGQRVLIATLAMSASVGSFATAQQRPVSGNPSQPFINFGSVSEGSPIYTPTAMQSSGSVMEAPVVNSPMQGTVIAEPSPMMGDMSAYGTAPASYSDNYSVNQTGYPSSYFDSGSACVTPGCDVSWYINYEAVAFRREGDDRFSLSRFARLPEFDYDLGEFGGRVTVGRLFDCVNGFEFVYTGPFKWKRSSNVFGTDSLQSRLVPTGDYTAVDIGTFNNANNHVQTYQAQLNSYEINRTWWTWDVLQTLIGVRYIDYEEDYLFSSGSDAGIGNYQVGLNNRAVGPQIGARFMRPISLRTSYGVKGKAAVLANFINSNSFMTNAGNVLIDSGDERVRVAGLIEIGAFINYQLLPSIRLTGGYEGWFLPGFATIPGQSIQRINLDTGTNVDNEDSVFVHGASGGVQILF